MLFFDVAIYKQKPISLYLTNKYNLKKDLIFLQLLVI